jgi:hypothetical protein
MVQRLQKLCCVLYLWNDTSAQTHAHSPIKLRGVKNKGQKPMNEEGAQEGINELHTVPIHYNLFYFTHTDTY